MENKRIILKYISLIIIIFIVGISILSVCFSLMDNNLSYDDAKSNCEKFLNSNKRKLNMIVKEVIKSKSKEVNEEYKIDGVRYISYDIEKGYITFDMDGQGFLGGQTWGLIYSTSNRYANEKELYIYDQNQKTTSGNNVFIREKIKDHWFFYYDDYDGKVDVKGIIDKTKIVFK